MQDEVGLYDEMGGFGVRYCCYCRRHGVSGEAYSN